MQILLPIAAAITAASLALAAIVAVVLWIRRRRFPWSFGKWTLVVHAPLAVIYFFVGAPAVVAWFLVFNAQTRGDEVDYSGPRVGADGAWIPQSIALHREERRGEATPDPGLVAAARERYVSFETEDGLTIGGWHVPARTGAHGTPVVCTHGWFRGGLEIDAVGAMFHDLGCEVLLLELRGHGRSDAAFTFGQDEPKDVRAAVRWLRSREGRAADRVLLFGVSIGSVATALAAPTIDGLAGVALDAPTESMDGVARRMLNPDSGGHLRRRSLRFPAPVLQIVLRFVHAFSGARLDAVRPIDGVRRLPADVPVLVVGGAEDRRMPPDVVEEVFAAVPAAPAHKRLWIRDGSNHGHVWIDDPEGYRERLAWLVEQALAADR